MLLSSSTLQWSFVESGYSMLLSSSTLQSGCVQSGYSVLLSRAAHASPATDRDPAFQPSRFTELYFPIAVLFRHEVMCVINARSSFDLVA